MQSGYGGVSEIQQFMVDGAAHTLFSTPPPNPSAAAAAAAAQEIHHPAAVQHYKFSPFHHHHQPSPSPGPAPHFPHFHSMPITQQLFTQPPHHHHHFQLFHPHQPALDHEPGPENSSTGASPSFLATAMNFKLAVNDSSGAGGGRQECLNNDNVGVGAGSILHGDEGSESRLRPWHREEDCAIKEPFWRPLDLDFINHNNKRCKDKELEHHFAKRIRDAGEPQGAGGGANYKIFSELEAIYKPGGSVGGAIAIEETTNNNPHSRPNQTGSGSALTGDEHNLMPPTAAAPAPDSRIEDDNSIGGEAQTKINSHQHSRRRRRRRQLQIGSVAAFFEGLTKQLMDQQEALHGKFLEAMERRDRERVVREESWREQEAAKSRRDATVRAHERALSAAREAAILSFLEKITGETLHLPDAAATASGGCVGDDQKLDDGDGDENGTNNKLMIGTSRWPKAEVQALIQVRSRLEVRFQEPGLKGPLWDEVSSAMEAMGYRRSSKRCKEKWENINKYFRKAKDSGRKRSQHSKTCPYFQQLDQLYSTSSKSLATPQSQEPAGDDPKNNSELLDAVVVSKMGEAEGEEQIGESEGQPEGPAMLEEEEEEDEEDDDEEVAAAVTAVAIEGFRPRD